MPSNFWHQEKCVLRKSDDSLDVCQKPLWFLWECPRVCTNTHDKMNLTLLLLENPWLCWESRRKGFIVIDIDRLCNTGFVSLNHDNLNCCASIFDHVIIFDLILSGWEDSRRTCQCWATWTYRFFVGEVKKGKKTHTHTHYCSKGRCDRWWQNDSTAIRWKKRRCKRQIHKHTLQSQVYFRAQVWERCFQQKADNTSLYSFIILWILFTVLYWAAVFSNNRSIWKIASAPMLYWYCHVTGSPKTDYFHFFIYFC